MGALSERVIFYDKQNIKELDWPDTEYGRYAQRYIMPIMEDSAEHFIRNVRTTLGVVAVDGIPIPITINEGQYENAYVCSPYTHYVSYAREELALLNNPILERLLSALLGSVGFMLRKARFNRVIQVNNWLLSTNLHPALDAGQLTAVLDLLRPRFADYAILYRSLSKDLCGPAVEELSKYGCKLVPSRQIYMLPHPHPSGKAKWLLKRDRALIPKHGYQVAGPDEIGEADISRIVELYEMLYIRKYSAHNPQFTESFIRMALNEGTLSLHGLRKGGRLDGILGFFCREGVMTAPLFGYDTSLPQSIGLYRMLSAVLIGLAEQNGMLLHESSGVGQFKRNRGAVPALEVTAVYDRNLPLLTRCCWSILQKLLKGIGVPIIQKLKL